jgi:hypothetical protein
VAEELELELELERVQQQLERVQVRELVQPLGLVQEEEPRWRHHNRQQP